MTGFLIGSYRVVYACYLSAKLAVRPVVIRFRSLLVYRELPRMIGLFDEAGIPYWLGGGVAYDAMRGRQTRPHNDLDLSIREEDVSRVRQLMVGAGFDFTQTRATSYTAKRQGLKVDFFAWRLRGENRLNFYDHFVVIAPVELFERVVMTKIGKREYRLVAPEVMHMFMPIVRNPNDCEFVNRLPLSPGYRIAKRVQEIPMLLDGLVLEATSRAEDADVVSATLSALDA
jgi:hypothetical protein